MFGTAGTRHRCQLPLTSNLSNSNTSHLARNSPPCLKPQELSVAESVFRPDLQPKQRLFQLLSDLLNPVLLPWGQVKAGTAACSSTPLYKGPMCMLCRRDGVCSAGKRGLMEWARREGAVFPKQLPDSSIYRGDGEGGIGRDCWDKANMTYMQLIRMYLKQLDLHTYRL